MCPCISLLYRRFYPDGQVIALLANEELSPNKAIPLLKPSLRMKVCYYASLSRRSDSHTP